MNQIVFISIFDCEENEQINALYIEHLTIDKLNKFQINISIIFYNNYSFNLQITHFNNFVL